jgi:hypothetical protein
MVINEFLKVKEFRIDNQYFELFRNKDGQYITVISTVDTNDKSAQFYNDFDMLYSVFSDELSEDELK